MASMTLPRGVKRVLQACENCRRKKTRCPGERPNCSTCTRLQQSCQYTGQDLDYGPTSKHARTLEDRLAYLEDKLERIGGGAVASPSTGRGDNCASTETQVDLNSASTPSTTNVPALSPSLVPNRTTLQKAIDIYFQCSHRQPVWLFASRDEVSPSSPDALMLTILGISVQYERSDFNNAGLQEPSVYNNAARRLIMSKISESAVEITTIQALCLLSYSNLVAGDLQLASFHVSLASNLLQCSGLDSHVSQDRTRAIEEQRRLYWSVRTIEVLCGLQKRMASLLDIQEPQYLVPEEIRCLTYGRAPLLPQEIYNIQGDKSLGIWAHMARSANLWSQIRDYVRSCAAGESKAPWHTDSGYTAINAQLLDMECGFPNSYRYDCAKFSERSPEEINRKRDFWLPWMKIQVTFHTIHSVLNHPFLYSARASKPKPGPNAFWKSSTDLALLHSTWIARLIGMAAKKGLVLADPFFAHAAAVAVTLHLYWSRASNIKISTPAEANLEICRSFLAEIGRHWPVCQNITDNVEALVALSSSAANAEPEVADAMAVHTSLVWKLLDFASLHRSPSGQSLFHPAWEADLRTRASSTEQVTLEDPQVNSPPGDLQTTTGDYASQPDWFSPLTSASPQVLRRTQNQPADPNQPQIAISAVETPAIQPGYEPSTWVWGTSDPSMALDPWTQFYGRAGPEPGWYDYGNL